LHIFISGWIFCKRKGWSTSMALRSGSFNLQYCGVSCTTKRNKTKDQSGKAAAALWHRVSAGGMMQLSDAVLQAGDSIAVRHPIQLCLHSWGSNGIPTQTD
jgi:hypothetical protein